MKDLLLPASLLVAVIIAFLLGVRAVARGGALAALCYWCWYLTSGMAILVFLSMASVLGFGLLIDIALHLPSAAWFPIAFVAAFGLGGAMQADATKNK